VDKNKSTISLWKAARVEAGTLALLMLGWAVVGMMGWVPDINSSLVAVGVYAAWVGLCVIVYRYFYGLDT